MPIQFFCFNCGSEFKVIKYNWDGSQENKIPTNCPFCGDGYIVVSKNQFN